MKRLAASAILLAAACGASGGDEAAVAEACRAGAGVSEELCDCVAARAMEAFTAEERAVLVEVLRDDDAPAPSDSDLSLGEVLAMALFITEAPAACAAERRES